MVLGIDLGTSNTVAASVSRDGNAVLVSDAYSRDLQSTPSVAIIDGRKAYAGNFADTLFETFPDKKLISFFKRNFGTQDPVHLDEKGNHWFSESIAALVLKKVKYDAEINLPDGFRNAVITVPAHYNDVQRKSVIEAARLADLELSAILEEPVAAALCYSSTNQNIDDELILVYDFGGGTFDLTLITKSGNQLHVIAKDGVNHLGGKEFDEIVSNSIKSQYQQAFQRDFPIDKLSQNRLQKAAEKIKIRLNDTDDPVVSKWLMVRRSAFECSFQQEDYRSKAASLIAKTDAAVTRCLRSLGISFSEVHKMILIGGTSCSKLVYNYWKNKVQPHQQLIYHQPLSSVAKGAALYAASLSQDFGQHHVQPMELRSVSTYNIGLRVKGSGQRPDVVIHRNTPLPVAAKKMYKVAAGQAKMLELELCQFWDEGELQMMGTITAGPFTVSSDMFLEVHVENKLNGTIGVKLKNGDTGRDVRFEFSKKESAHKYDFQQQQGLVQNVYLNNNI